MGVRFDYASSILLCAEDNNSLLDLDDVGNQNEDVDFAKEMEIGAICGKRCDFYGNLLMDFPVQSDESLSLMIEKESDFLPKVDYLKRLMNGELDISVRNDAIDWISKVHAQFNFGPITLFLSINYLDRFLSLYELPKGKAWMTQLLSVTCLSLAAKMEETEVPLFIDLQVGEAKYVFEAKTIQRMEILVLATLNWRMQALTSLSFLDYFIHKFNHRKLEMTTLISSALELGLISIREISLLEYKPSEIAAALALLCLEEIHAVDIDGLLTGCILLDKERTLRCYNTIKEVVALKKMNAFEDSKFSLPSSVPQSPNAVLDIRSLSDGSDDISTQGSQPQSCSNSPAAKRMKLQ